MDGIVAGEGSGLAALAGVAGGSALTIVSVDSLVVDTGEVSSLGSSVIHVI